MKKFSCSTEASKKNFSFLADRSQISLEDLYVKAKFIRSFEYKLLELFSKGKINGTTHTSIGQEANAIGIASACLETDIFVSNHRCHAHLLSHVGSADLLIKEIMGDSSGFCGGLGGSQHICVPNRFYSNGIQGGIMPLAAGLAFAIKRSGSDSIVCVFVGDGTTGQGALYETINLAQCWRLPLLIVVEDNKIAQTTDTNQTIAGSISDRFNAFGIKTSSFSYPTAFDLFNSAQEIVRDVRKGFPNAIIIESARLGPHSKGDDTRSMELIQALKVLDPLVRMENELKGDDRLQNANQRVDDLLISLENSIEIPIAEAQNILPKYLQLTQSQEDLSELSGAPFFERLNLCLGRLMSRNDECILVGEDIGDPYGGAFKVTKGLQLKFPQRVIQTPISEQGFTGLAAGAALLGVRPIVEFMFGDFILLAMDQLVNHAAKYSLMYNHQVDCPLVIRLPMGGGRGYGPTHSQSLEKHLCGIPNVQVISVTPYAPLEPVFKLIENTVLPIVIVENKLDYFKKVNFQEDIANKYDVIVKNSFITYSPSRISKDLDGLIFVYGGQVGLALEVADKLSQKNIFIKVVVLIQLSPFPKELFSELEIISSRAIFTLEESSVEWGFGSEIAAQILIDEKFSSIKFIRIGALDTVIAASRSAENKALPSLDRLMAKIQEVLSSTCVPELLVDALHNTSPNLETMTNYAIARITLPQINANDDEAKIIELMTSNEQLVTADQPVITIETSKVVEDILAPCNGYILHHVQLGNTVKTGEIVSSIFENIEDLRLAKNNKKIEAKVGQHDPFFAHNPLDRNIQLVKTSSIHKGMIKTIELSHQTIPTAHLVAVSELPIAEKGVDTLDSLIYHLAKVLSNFPNANAYYAGDLYHYKKINVGYTVDVDGDLYMGVIEDAEKKTSQEIAQERMDTVLSLFRGARVPKNMNIQPTICVTGLKGKWITQQMPIVYPNTGVIMGIVSKEITNKINEIVLTASYDHRVISGFEIAKFLDGVLDSWRAD